MQVKIVNKSSNPSPAYATPLSAGMDIRANLQEPLTLNPLQRMLFLPDFISHCRKAMSVRLVREVAWR